MIQKKYTRDFHLDCFLLDSEGKASLVTYFNLMQEIALKHAMLLGFGKDDMKDRSMFWVLTRMGLKITKTLKWDDVVTITTWSKGLNGPFSFREFLFFDSTGNSIGQASSSWVPLDMKTRRPAKIIDPNIINDKSIPGESVDLELDKIFLPNNLESGYSHNVRNTDLDINAHANNARYVEWIYNSLPLDFFKNKNGFDFQINYLGEAKLHDQVVINRSPLKTNESEFYFEGANLATKNNFFTARLR